MGGGVEVAVFSWATVEFSTIRHRHRRLRVRMGDFIGCVLALLEEG
jgi:hypothetical protein